MGDVREDYPAELTLDLDGGDQGPAEVGLSWLSKKQARVAIPKPHILETAPEHSDTTPEDPGNLVIEGDNRQAMVSLLSQYGGKVDVVLIDPPYNTGKNDFRYDDRRFTDPDAAPSRGDFVSAEDGGRHTKWLNQMTPTLRIIWDLMAPTGVIFVHINEIELPRLLMLMEDIFHEQNRIATMVWKQVTDNNPGRVVVEHEFILVWAKSAKRLPAIWTSQEDTLRADLTERAKGIVAEEGGDLVRAQKRLRTALTADKERLGNFARYYRLDQHWNERGPYASIRNTDNPGKPGYFYDVLHPVTGKVVTKPGTGYRFSEETMDRLRKEDRLVFGKDEKKLLEIKRYVSEVEAPLRSVIEIDARKGANRLAKLWSRAESPFRNPKPVELEELLLSYATGTDSLVLDAFAGSGTTGHAVMSLNKRDSGKRRFILIEEGNSGDNYATTLTAERLRRARRVEKLPGGFTFQRVGPAIDVEALAHIKRGAVAQAILQTDASGKGGGIKAIDGKWVIGANARREAICLHFDPKGKAPVTRAILAEMFAEADELKLARPLRVYAFATEVFDSESFRFMKLPKEVADNLTVALRVGR